MSNLVVDGILFYHGGAADLGTNEEVVKNFGPIECDHYTGISPDNFTNTRINLKDKTMKELAELAKELGANAVICYRLNPQAFGWGDSKPHHNIYAAGDAVLIKPKGAS